MMDRQIRRPLSPVQRAARRHSILVRVLKILLPLTGVFIVAGMVVTIVLFNYLNDLGIGTVRLTSDGIVMENPTLSGNDGDRGYRVTATRAIQRISNPNIIDLDSITASLQLSAKQKVSLTSVKGTFDNSAQTLKLFDGIGLTATGGYQAELKSVDINMKTMELETSSPIKLMSQKGSLQSGKMTYDQDKGTVLFTNGVKMILTPGAKGM